MNKEKHSVKRKRWLVWLLIVLAVIIISVWPTNYYIESPGTAQKVSELMTSKAGKPDSHFYMLTVAERPAGLLDYGLSFLRSDESRVSKQELLAGQSTKSYELLQHYYMTTSQNNALYYAAKKAGRHLKMKYLGIYVLDLLAGSSFKHKLSVGDTIIKINGQHFKSTPAMMSYLRKQKIGDKVSITYWHHGKTKQATGKICKVKSTGKPGLGVELVDRTQVTFTPKIKINAGSIGGPSAGLMFSLTAYQSLTGKNLTRGRKVAGTGTIDAQGKVGIIGGVDKKVIAADRAGAKIFFAPTQKLPGMKKKATNYAEAKRTARRIHSKMKIVPVAKFEDAVAYLEK